MRVRELSRCVCDGRHRRGVLVARRQLGTGRGRGPKIQSFTTPLPHASLSQRHRRAVPPQLVVTAASTLRGAPPRATLRFL